MREEFIKKAVLKHGLKYDYSRVKYIKSNIKVKIKCSKHGIFEQIPNSHLNGSGCSKCGRDRTIASNLMSKEEFIDIANKIHKNKYNYSFIQFRRCRNKIDIECPKHGIFKQTPSGHIAGNGCPKCARELKKYNQMTTKEFISKAIKIHGNKYDYSNSVYIRSRLKVKVRCIKHDFVFEATPNNHLRGCGCYKCGLEKIGDLKRKNPQKFIEKSKKIHKNKYDYSLVNYKKCDEKVRIICPKHGEFLQLPTVHLVGKGCPICGKWSLLTTEKFIKKARKVHGNLYDYFLVKYKNSRTPVKIKCSKHGLFEQKANGHLKGQGCPTCLESHGERKISQFLSCNNIKFKREKSFDGCRYNKYPLLFDFYLSDLNTCIEYDGLQHFQPIAYFGGEKIFKKIKEYDRTKNEFCKNNKINLIRIPYTSSKNIEEILKCVM